MLPPIPFWMRQRQIKLEPVNDTTVALKTPNLPPYELVLRPLDGSHGYPVAIFSVPADGQKALVAEQFSETADAATAWQYAFELFRQKVIIQLDGTWKSA